MKLLLFSIVVFYSAQLSAQVDSAMLRRMDMDILRRRDSIIQHSIGKPFTSYTATSLSGDTLSEKQLVGKVTMINFWFKNCAPCITEMNPLKALYQMFKGNLNFQFISFSSDSPSVASDAVQAYQIPYTVCPIGTSECHRLNFNSGFPTNMIIDQAGKISFFKIGLGVKEGELPLFQQLEQRIDSLLSLPTR